MKLLRYGTKGHEKPGLLDAQGKIRDLSHVVSDIAGEALTPASLAKLNELDVERLPARGDTGVTKQSHRPEPSTQSIVGRIVA